MLARRQLQTTSVLLVAAGCLLLAMGVAAAGKVVDQIPLGSSPVDVEIAPDVGMLYAATDDGVSVVDLATRGVIRSLAVAPSPIDVARDPRSDRLWVLQPRPRNGAAEGQVSVIDASDGSVLKTWQTRRGPTALASDPSRGFVYVVDFYAATIEVYDAFQQRRIAVLGGRRWAEGKVGLPEDVVVDTKRGVALASTTNGFIIKLRGPRIEAKKRVLSPDDHRLAVDRRRGLTYATQFDAGNVVELRTRDLRILSRLRTRSDPWDVAVDPRLRVLGIVTQSNETSYLEAIDLPTRVRLARVNTGFGGSDVATVPGSWRFYVTDTFGDAILVAPGEDTLPVSVLDIEEGATLSVGEQFSGRSSDDRSGVDGAQVVFENEAERHEVQLSLVCATTRSCTWTGEVPDAPGVYRVTTLARDVAGNLEVDREPVTVTVLP